MKRKLMLSITVLVVSICSFGCGNNGSVTENTQKDTTKLPPVEKKNANTDYKPAFKGQTRINGVRTATAYKVEKIAEKLGRPWALFLCRTDDY